MIKGSILVSPGFFISFILVIIIICIVLIIVQPNTNTKKNDGPPELADNYFQRADSWSTTTGKDTSIRTNRGNTVNLSGTSICSLYTYENEFDIDVKPNIKNLFQDFYDKLVHKGSAEGLKCIDANQLLAYNGEHTCNSNEVNACIDAFGNYIAKGKTEEYAVNCRDNLPLCPGGIFSISLNFQLSPFNTLNTNTKFLAIDTLATSTEDYNRLQSENSFYFNQGIFIEDTTLSKGTFVPTFFNDFYKSSSARQQYKIIRYKYDTDKQAWEIDDLGPFAAIIFQPANAYLTAEKETKDYKFIFKSMENVSDEDTIQWFFMPALDLNPSSITTDTKYSKGNIQSLSSGTSIFGTYTSQADNLGLVEIPPNIAFPDYKDVVVNETVISLNNYGSNPTIQFYDNGKIVQPNLLTYPQYIFKAIQGGKADINNDFYSLSFSATLTDTDQGSQLPGGPVTPLPLDQFFSQTLINPDGQGQVYTTLFSGLDTTKPIGELNYGNIITDNNALWEVLDPTTTVTAFDNNYFLQSQGTSAVKTITLNQSNNAGDIKYKTPGQGLVNKIITTQVQYDYSQYTPGAYTINLNNTDTSLDITPNEETNAIATVIFTGALDTNGNNITVIESVLINDKGTGYSNTTFSINSTALGASSSVNDVTDLALDTIPKEVIVYSAVAQSTDNDSDGNPLPFDIINDRADLLKNRGLVISEDLVDISNGVFNLASSNVSITITNGGFGYAVDDIIYINQLDQFGNSIFGEDYNPKNISDDNMKKLASIKVTDIQSNSIGLSFAAPDSLIRTPGANGGINLTNDQLIYNFYKNENSQYLFSPPQIAFVGEGFVDQIKEVIKSGSADEIASFIASTKKGGPGTNDSFFSDVDNIKTIQFTNLNYIGRDQSDNTSQQLNNNVAENTQPVLGRFIPYSEFQPPTYANDTETIPTGKGTTIFYNNNYTQLVPYGLKNIYNQFIESQNLASI